MLRSNCKITGVCQNNCFIFCEDHTRHTSKGCKVFLIFTWKCYLFLSSLVLKKIIRKTKFSKLWTLNWRIYLLKYLVYVLICCVRLCFTHIKTKLNHNIFENSWAKYNILNTFPFFYPAERFREPSSKHKFPFISNFLTITWPLPLQR